MTKVGIVMGSISDAPIMEEAKAILNQFGIAVEMTVASAHRAPEMAVNFSKSAQEKGFKVLIAGAGGAAHLPGVIAAFTTLPVIGVPLRSRISVDGWDSILSILQMPPGVPVATVALDGARNAGILAAQILGTSNPEISQELSKFKEEMRKKTEASASQLS